MITNLADSEDNYLMHNDNEEHCKQLHGNKWREPGQCHLSSRHLGVGCGGVQSSLE